MSDAISTESAARMAGVEEWPVITGDLYTTELTMDN